MIKRRIAVYLKNLPGKRIDRKLLMLAVDDYGNVHLASRKAREKLKSQGLYVDANRFTTYDALETADDLHALFDTLRSVKDKDGKPAVFTAFSTCANIHFERSISEGTYCYELLPDTLAQSESHRDVWQIWQQGSSERLLVPQFHGREHLNVRLFNTLLEKKHPGLMANLQQRSYAAIRHDESKVGYTEAFSFKTFDEVNEHREIIKDGLIQFEKVFGHKALHFNAPGAREHKSLHPAMKEQGIRMIDTDIIKKEHQGEGRYKRIYTPQGRMNPYGQMYIYRNAVFEPNLDEHTDWVNKTMMEINTAFSLGKPAIVSSHRVNFCGWIEEQNRTKGLAVLKRLLQTVVKQHPDVEFVSSEELEKVYR